jgi:hypothetical protein
MLLHHGSNQEIMSINLNCCKPFKDFGRGFYLTTIEEQAEIMAKRNVRVYGGAPVVTSFKFDETVLSGDDLSVKVFAEPDADWALFVLNNRNRDFTAHTDPNSNHDNKYDIVTGPVANDDIVLLFRKFVNGHIELEALVKEMKYKKLSNQYSFHTERAVALLSKTGATFHE